MNLDYVRLYFRGGNFASLSASAWEEIKQWLNSVTSAQWKSFPNTNGGEAFLNKADIEAAFLVTLDELEEVWQAQVEYRKIQNGIDPTYNWDHQV